MADDPCFAYLSSSGLLARTSTDEQPGEGGARANHDVVVSAVRTTARGEVGVLTSRGRLVKLGVLDLPTLPASANDPNLQGGLPLSEVLSLDAGERALALSALATDGPGLALGTRQGVVKRVNPEVLGKDEWEVIGLKDGDEVVGAVELATGDETLCFITSDAQLLHFGADGVRPQGRSGGGMAGVRVAAGQAAVWFGAVDPADVGRRDGLRLVHRPARHRARRGQGDAVLGVPRQGPGHRRRPLPPLPQGRGHPGLRLGRHRPGPGGRGQRGARRPARGRPAGGTAPASPGASRSRPARDPVAARLGGCHPVWQADPMSTPALCASVAVVAALLLAGCSGDEKSVSDDKTPEEVLALAATTLDETSGVDLTLSSEDLPDGVTVLKAADGVGTHAPAFDGTITVVLAGTDFDVPVDRGRRQGLRPDPAHARLVRRRPGRVRRPRPRPADEHRRRLLLAAARHRPTSRRARPSAAARTTRRSSPSTPAPCPATWSRTSSRAPSGEFDATYTITADGELREAVLTGVFYPDTEPMTYTLGFDDYGTEKEITAP